MTLYEFLERLEANPFDPEIIAVFDKTAAESARNAEKPADTKGDENR